ncbi:unnamed protein product [Discula destructiva]
MHLPRELHIQIANECYHHPVRTVPYDASGPLGRHGRRTVENRVLRCGSLRDLTLVSHYFRELTAPYLWESICVDDCATDTVEDKLQNTHAALVRQRHRFEYMKKLTVSFGRTPNAPRAYGAEDLIELLRAAPDIRTVRFVLETTASTFTILPRVKKQLIQAMRDENGVQPLRLTKIKQMELSCVWGSHNWDFGHLTWPYLGIERLLLDFDLDSIDISGMALDFLPSLEYVMQRAAPVSFFRSSYELDEFEGLTVEDEGRKPYLEELADNLPQVKHLALYGVLKGPISEVARLLRSMTSLEQLDVTDEQPISLHDIEALTDMWHPFPDIDWAMKHTHLTNIHPDNTNRVEAAAHFFALLPSLRRICFVRDQIGTYYTRVKSTEQDKPDTAVKGDTVVEAFRCIRYGANPRVVWRCGFPNRLGAQLWDASLQTGTGGGNAAWLPREDAFWLDPRFRAGDESVVPHRLLWDVATETQFGKMPDHVAAELERWYAKQERQWQQRQESQRRSAWYRTNAGLRGFGP